MKYWDGVGRVLIKGCLEEDMGKWANLKSREFVSDSQEAGWTESSDRDYPVLLT